MSAIDIWPEPLPRAASAGLAHVSTFIDQAIASIFAQPAPMAPAAMPLASQHPVAKCDGAGLTACASCVRNLAPACAGQQWLQPVILGGGCMVFASVENYGALCGLVPKGGASA